MEAVGTVFGVLLLDISGTLPMVLLTYQRSRKVFSVAIGEFGSIILVSIVLMLGTSSKSLAGLSCGQHCSAITTDRDLPV